MPRPRLKPFTLFSVTAAGATRSKLLWPGGSYVSTLPDAATGNVSPINNATADCGGVIAIAGGWGSVLLDFAGVGAADQTLAIEIGKFYGTGTLAHVIASATLKSITTSGTTTANINPFTGEATASTTWRLFDLVTVTSRGGLGQVLTNLGGLEDESPAQLTLDVSEAPYYYVLVTSLGSLTAAMCVVTPRG